MGDIHSFILCVCVCSLSTQQGKGCAGSAGEGGALCLQPFHGVFPALWTNSGSLISTSEMSRHRDPGRRSWEAQKVSPLEAELASVHPLPDFHMLPHHPSLSCCKRDLLL